MTAFPARAVPGGSLMNKYSTSVIRCLRRFVVAFVRVACLEASPPVAASRVKFLSTPHR
jgi:hypothetical protein